MRFLGSRRRASHFTQTEAYGARGEEKVDLTSMVDIVFLLLVFFMVATQFRTNEGSLETWLPRDRGHSTGPVEVETPCRITLYRDGDQIVAFADRRAVPARSPTDRGEDDLAIFGLAEQEETFGLIGPDRRVIEQHLTERLATWRGVTPGGMPVGPLDPSTP